ncbi:unnamed protein product [Kuraishia capsulata CBS 1993]|uniref:SH3 domain-containing protein n=1 Tax=Kuraishia capsulata CBS 1993 TaxID=1382522 RepID=W6MR93_9ASCO|nr:uncharacterized protein KUCA_T00004868001 [Kuraishia capsulata CBS 1993]CDK28883.1 unnamed protein product [Kuraishia capsulata CBS 1993]
MDETRWLSPGRREFSSDSDRYSTTSSVVVNKTKEGIEPVLLKGSVKTLDVDKLLEDAALRHDNRSSDEDEDVNDDFQEESALDSFLSSMGPSPPSSPPRNLDPGKLYALLNFSGPDAGHIELTKDDPVELLNDEDSYWWLVRKLNSNESQDDVIGFAPAEILETYEERLARLNCWKNENLERNLKENPSFPIEKEEGEPDVAPEPITPSGSIKRKSSLRKSRRSLLNSTPKNVSFAEKFETEDEKSEVFSEAYSDCVPLQIQKRGKRLGFKNMENFTEEDDDDDDYEPEVSRLSQYSHEDNDETIVATSDQERDDIPSDMHFTEDEDEDEDQGNIDQYEAPRIFRARKAWDLNRRPSVGSLESDASDLVPRFEKSSIFMAPNARFKTATQESIGSYSPDSSECSPETTPPMNTFQTRQMKSMRIKEDKLRDIQKRAQIPLSGRTLDIASTFGETSIVTTPCSDEDDTNDSDAKECSIISNTASSSSSLPMNSSTPATSSSFVTPSVDDYAKPEPIREGDIIPKEYTSSSGESETTLPCIKQSQPDSLHPTTARIFNPVFSQLDELEKMLRELLE